MALAPLPKRWNPLPIKIRFLNHTAAVSGTLLDSDFGQLVGGVNKPVSADRTLQAQVVYQKDQRRTAGYTGDLNEGDGHLCFTEDYLKSESLDPLGSGDKIKKGDRIVELAGHEVNYKIIEMRPAGHLATRGNTPMLWLAYFEFDREKQARVG